MISHNCIFLILISTFLFVNKVLIVDSGANNMHLLDGTSTSEIIGGDIFFEIIDPEELSYTYRARPAKDFGLPFNETFYQNGAHLVPVDPVDSCSFPTNAADLEGNIGLIERGQCSFLSKTMRAQEAGALGVIITDSDMDDSFYIEMIDDKTERTPQIPAAFLLGINGHVIRKILMELNRKHAVINIPLNLTYVSFHEVKQPPWLLW